MDIRPAEPGEIEILARLWHQGWLDAHAAVVPAELTRRRTLESFVPRLAAAIDDLRVAGPVGAPQGLCIIKGDELFQLYVAAGARGSGIAAGLIDDGERRLAARGVVTAWLACAIGNQRAAAFYEKRGWYRARTMTDGLETPEGPFLLEVWRYEKVLRD